MKKKEKREILATLSRAEVRLFNELAHQKQSLLELLGTVNKQEQESWNSLRKTYNLPKEKHEHMSLDHKTGNVYKAL